VGSSLFARVGAAKDVEILVVGTTSPCCADTTHARS
jgi:hypothetical protein